MDDSCIMVFTSRSVEQMFAEGGSQAWKLGSVARKYQYVVCTWNPTGEYAQPYPSLRHGEAFLVAPIASIEFALPPEDPSRYIIRFTQYQLISLPDRWNGQRNPFTYTSLSELGIALDGLHFEHVPPPSTTVSSEAVTPSAQATSLTIAMAKLGLSRHYGVDVNAIEITIRG